MSQTQYDIFISYSSKDKDSAFHICKALEKEGFICWIAPRNIGVGHYANAIVEAIENSKALVLVFSSHSNQSIPVLNEIEIAVNKKLPIIPIRIEDILPTKSMKYYLMSNNWFDIFDFNTDLKKIIDTVKETLDENYSSSNHLIDNKKTFPFSSLKLLIIVFIFIIMGILFFKENNTPREKGNIAIEILSKEITKQAEEKVYWKKKYFELKEQYQDYPHLISKAEEIQQDKGFQEAVNFYLNIKETNYQEFEIKNISSSNLTEKIIQKKDINKSEVNQDLINIDNEEVNLLPVDSTDRKLETESLEYCNLVETNQTKELISEMQNLLDSSPENLDKKIIEILNYIIKAYQKLVSEELLCQRINNSIKSSDSYEASQIYRELYEDCNSLYQSRLEKKNDICSSLKKLISFSEIYMNESDNETYNFLKSFFAFFNKILDNNQYNVPQKKNQ